MNPFATHPLPSPLYSLNAKRAHLFLRDRDQQPASFRQGDGKGRGFDLNQPLSPPYLQRNAGFEPCLPPNLFWNHKPTGGINNVLDTGYGCCPGP